MNETLEIRITADTDKAEKALEDTAEKVEDLADESEEASKAMEEAFKAAGDAINSALKITAGAIAGASTAILGLAASTRDYRTAQGKLITAFENAGASAETAMSVYEELNGTLGDSDRAVEAANHLAQLTTNQQELSEWADICTGIFATFGDSLPIEGLTEAANETAKVGTVTGGLADALNWAGESEDEFNAQLAECVDTQQREKLIREKLTSLYKKAGDQYKKTNKDVINANKASDKMNQTLAKMGKTVEPVATELKEMGTKALAALQEPLEAVVSFISNYVLPAIEAVAKWVKNNKELVIGMATGLAAALVTFKVASLAATAAEEGLTIATIARTAAQKALNAVMSATPWGLVATGVAAVVGGLAAYAIATYDAEAETRKQYKALEDMDAQIAVTKDGVTEMHNAEEYLAEALENGSVKINENTGQLEALDGQTLVYIDSVKQLTEEQKAQLEATEELMEKNKEHLTQTEEKAGAIEAEFGYVEDLADELMRLADETGKVKEADEARVKFILNELNAALGTEYSLVDGVIDKYDQLKTSIYDVIDAKTANALLENFSDSHLKAIEAEDTLMQAVNNAYQEYQNQLALSNVEIQKYQKQIEETEELKRTNMEKGRTTFANENQRYIDSLNKKIEKEKEKIKEQEDNYKKFAQFYADNQKVIDKYEEASAAIMEGNYKDAIEMLGGKAIAYNNYGNEVDKATQKVLDALYDEAIQAGLAAEETKHKFESGVEGYTKEMVKEAEKGYEDALAAWNDAYDEAYGIGGDMGEGLKEGLENKRSTLLTKAKNIISAIWQGMRNEADSHSPSRKTMALGGDMGAGLEIGLDKSTDDVVKTAKNMIDKTIIPIEGVISGVAYENIGGIFSSSAQAANGAVGGSIAGAATDLASTQWIERLAQMLGANDKPIVLEVDGKVFAETSINSINQLTKQTGVLALNII